MGGLVAIATSILTQSSQRVEVSAQNLSNIGTAGYKRRLEFSQLLAADSSGAAGLPAKIAATDFSDGKLVNTGNPYDLAISGDGFFAVRSSADQVAYTRQGQFRRDEDGRLLTASGAALQAEGGGDLLLKDRTFTVAADGTVLEDGEPTARIGLVDFVDRQDALRGEGGDFSVPDAAVRAVSRPSIHQGMIESSNVGTGDEMVSIMEALRRAEAGQRLVTVYDDLMGRALTAFGQF
jgi:flagellar basal-body rod protein FlgF